MENNSWKQIWQKGVDLANSFDRERKDFEYVIIENQSNKKLGDTDINDPEWVNAINDALKSKTPSIAFEYWRKTGWLAYALPEIDKLWGIPQTEKYHPEIDTGIHAMMVLDRAAYNNSSIEAMWAALAHDFGKSITPKDILPSHIEHERKGVPLVHNRFINWNIPKETLNICLAVTGFHGLIHNLEKMRAVKILKLIEDLNFESKPEMLKSFCEAIEADDQGRKGFFNSESRGTSLLKEVVNNLNHDKLFNFDKWNNEKWENRVRRITLNEKFDPFAISAEKKLAFFNSGLLEKNRLESVKISLANYDRKKSLTNKGIKI